MTLCLDQILLFRIRKHSCVESRLLVPCNRVTVLGHERYVYFREYPVSTARQY